VRVAGVALAAFLLLPLPRSGYLKHRGETATSLGSELLPGPGGAVRWLVGDVYYRSAVLARDRKDWDGALSAHLNALMWAPSRMDNWIGYGDTALAAMQNMSGKPIYWLQYGKMGYYRAQKMQPLNGYLFYGEARLLAEAVRRGGQQFYPDAKADFERAVTLYPNVARFHSDYGQLLERMGERESARREKDLALRLRSNRAGVEPAARERVSLLPSPGENLNGFRSGGTEASDVYVASGTRRGDRRAH
jgi:tetratricopeptide (TPR) repeat protein